jgi:hypothetical protein
VADSLRIADRSTGPGKRALGPLDKYHKCEEEYKMKLLAAMIMVLSIAAITQASELGGAQGTLVVGAYAGYGVGFGDEFKKSKLMLPLETITTQTKPGIGFGGNLYYGIGNRLFLGIAADFLRMKNRRIVETMQGPLFETEDLSEFDTWIALNVNAKYCTGPLGSLYPYFEAGPGLYFDPDDRTGGVNGGLGATLEVATSVVIDAGARVHVLLGSSAVVYGEIHVGLDYCLIGIDK